MLKKIGNIFIGVLLLVVTIPPMAYAADLSVNLDKNNVLLGDSITLTITVREDNNPQTPEVRPIPGFDIKFRGTRQESFSRMTVIIQGKRVENKQSGGGYHFDYELIPQSPGDYDIPFISITYKGQGYRTDSYTIRVFDESEKSDEIFMEITADKTEAYLGEKILVTFKWYFSKNLNGYRLNIPWLEGLKGFMVTDPELDPNQRYQRFTVNGNQEVIATKSTEFHKGQQYAVISFQKILTPIATGVFELEPTFLKADVIMGYQKSRRNSFFDSFFDSDFDSFFGMGRQAITEPFSTKSNALPISVSEVPYQDKPSSYSGAVGSFDFKVSVSPTKLKVGEPITATMSIRGKGNIENIELPPFPELGNFKTYEPEVKTESKSVGGEMVGERIFETVLIPRSAGQYTIPPIAFTYFNPRTRSYETIKEGPYTIYVDEAPEEEQAPLVMIQEPGEAMPAKREVKTISQDIRYIKTDIGKVHPTTQPVYTNPWIWILGFVLPLVIVMALYFLRANHEKLSSDIGFRRHRGALKSFKMQMMQADSCIQDNNTRGFYDNLCKAMDGYLSDKLNRNKASVHSEMLNELQNHKVDQNTIHDLKAIYDRSESAIYSSQSVSIDQLTSDFHKANDIVQKLEKVF